MCIENLKYTYIVYELKLLAYRSWFLESDPCSEREVITGHNKHATKGEKELDFKKTRAYVGALSNFIACKKLIFHFDLLPTMASKMKNEWFFMRIVSRIYLYCILLFETISFFCTHKHNNRWNSTHTIQNHQDLSISSHTHTQSRARRGDVL